MSKTDKTRPYVVQILDSYNKGWVQEDHNHANKICDLTYRSTYRDYRGKRWVALRFIPRDQCQWGESIIAINSGLFPRPPRSSWSRLTGREGPARAKLRAQVHEWRKLVNWEDIEDIDEREFEPTQAQLWRHWG